MRQKIQWYEKEGTVWTKFWGNYHYLGEKTLRNFIISTLFFFWLSKVEGLHSRRGGVPLGSKLLLGNRTSIKYESTILIPWVIGLQICYHCSLKYTHAILSPQMMMTLHLTWNISPI